LETPGSTKVESFIREVAIFDVVIGFFRDGEVEEAEKVYFVYVSGFVKAVFRLVGDRFTRILAL